VKWRSSDSPDAAYASEPDRRSAACGSCFPPSSSIGADRQRVGAGSKFGEADRMRRDRRERPRRGGRELDNWPARKMVPRCTGCVAESAWLICGVLWRRAGARRPGLPKA